MAKSLRSRRIKVNKRALKEKVFAPVENARTQRLSAKLQQLAAEPKPPKDTEMAETMPEEQAEDLAAADTESKPEPMDVVDSTEAVLRKSRKSNRIQKRGRTRLGQSTVFPVYSKTKKLGVVKQRRRKP